MNFNTDHSNSRTTTKDTSTFSDSGIGSSIASSTQVSVSESVEIKSYNAFITHCSNFLFVPQLLEEARLEGEYPVCGKTFAAEISEPV
jgi:hypothetical protein